MLALPSNFRTHPQGNCSSPGGCPHGGSEVSLRAHEAGPTSLRSAHGAVSAVGGSDERSRCNCHPSWTPFPERCGPRRALACSAGR
eukprot:3166465-Alexandrium_andersonii.AAC.1